MNRRGVGNSGLRVSRTRSGHPGSWGRETDGDEAAAQLVAFVDAGGTLVDTSPEYTRGAAQGILAGVLGDVVPRSAVVLSGCSGATPPRPTPTASTAPAAACSANSTTPCVPSTPTTSTCGASPRGTPRPRSTRSPRTLDYAVTSGRVRYVGARGYAPAGSWPPLAAGTPDWWRSRPSTRCSSAAPRSNWSRRRPPRRRAAAAGAAGRRHAHRQVPRRRARPTRGAPTTHAARDGGGYLDKRATRVVEAVVTAADGLGASPLAVALAWMRDRRGIGTRSSSVPGTTRNSPGAVVRGTGAARADRGGVGRRQRPARITAWLALPI